MRVYADGGVNERIFLRAFQSDIERAFRDVTPADFQNHFDAGLARAVDYLRAVGVVIRNVEMGVGICKLHHHPSLSQLRPVRSLFQKSRQHGPSFFAHRSRQDHPLRLQAEYLSWLEVCDDDYFAPDQFFRLVILRDAGQYLARLGLAKVDCEPQQLVGFRYALGRQNLAYAQFDFRKILDRDVGRRRRRLTHGLRRLSRRLNGLFFALFCSRGAACRFFLFDFVHDFLLVQFGEDWFDFADALARGLAPPQRVRRDFSDFACFARLLPNLLSGVGQNWREQDGQMAQRFDRRM